MPLIHGASLPYPVHATLRSSMRRKFGLSMSSLWEILGESIASLQQTQDFHVHAALLMSNHVHLLLTAFNVDTESLLKTLGSRSECNVRRKFGLPDLQFGLQPSSYEIRHPVYFCHAMKYIYRNPVSAGICRRVEEYPFSTIHALLGTALIHFPLHETYFNLVMIPRDHAEFLRWLNTSSIDP